MKKGKPVKRCKAQRQKSATTPEEAEEKERLDAARNYWLSVELVTQGRYLHGAESAIAADAFATYVEELRKCKNQDVVFPKAPKSATLPELSAFELAHVATQLAAQEQKETTSPGDDDVSRIIAARRLFPQARELLIQAASYLKDCALKPLANFAQVDGVCFDEILKSNQKTNVTKLKLLPGFTGGSQSAKGERYKGLINFIRRYYAAHRVLLLTKEQQRKVKEQSGRELVSIKDETCEMYISKKFLPINELVQIRAWLFRQKRAPHVK